MASKVRSPLVHVAGRAVSYVMSCWYGGLTVSILPKSSPAHSGLDAVMLNETESVTRSKREIRTCTLRPSTFKPTKGMKPAIATGAESTFLTTRTLSRRAGFGEGKGHPASKGLSVIEATFSKERPQAC